MPITSGLGWTDDRVALLKKLWADGLTAAQISVELGGFGNCIDGGRSAVIGKVHRLNFSGRVRRPPAPRKPRAPRIRTRTAPTVEQQAAIEEQADTALADANLAAPDERRVSFSQLDADTCRWPVGDPQHEGFYFCGGKPLTGMPYCAYHCRVAYTPGTIRRNKSGADRSR